MDGRPWCMTVPLRNEFKILTTNLKTPSENIPPHKEQGFGASGSSERKSGSRGWTTMFPPQHFSIHSSFVPVRQLYRCWPSFYFGVDLCPVTQVCRPSMSQKKVNTSKKPTYSSNVSDIENKNNDAEHKRTSFFVLGLHCG